MKKGATRQMIRQPVLLVAPPAVSAGSGEAEEHTAETEGRKYHGQHVDMRVGRLAHVVHREAGGRDHAVGDCHQQREHPTPAQPFDQQTGDGGAQCRSKGDDHAHRIQE